MCWLCWTPASLGLDGGNASSILRAEATPGASPGGPAGAAPRLHLLSSFHAGVDGLLSGYAWAGNTPVSFAFPDSASDYEAFYGSSEPARGFAQIGPLMRDAMREILLGAAAGVGAASPGPSVLGFTNLALVEATQDFAADIRIGRSSAPTTAWAYYPNGREGGDVWLGARYDFNDPRLGNYQFMLAVHELGHALGLKHPHEAANGFAAMPLEWDSLEFTAMSYRSRPGASVDTGYTNGTYDFPQGWMMLDIAALQELYGADYTLHAADTRYSWNPATGETFIDGIGQGAPGANRVFLTIWDGGGIDTYDLSSYAGGVALDLAPGGYSVLSAAQLATLDVRDGTKARGNVFNALLHDGSPASLIENALGGAGADTLLGNTAANRLEGGAGNDWLDGREGADMLIGGAGADTMVGGSGSDTFVVDSPDDRIIELPGTEIDTMIVETPLAITLPTGVEVLRLGQAGRIGIGNAGANLLHGNAAANLLDGREGADLLEGGAGNDTLIGGSGPDMFIMRRGDGFDRIEDFAPGQDRLVLTGFDLTAAELLAHAQATAGGLVLGFGGGDGVLLAGLLPGALSAADFVLSG